MAGIKIVDLPAVGRDLAATDLFEMSLVGGTGSRKITGQEIMNASKLSVGSTPVINGSGGGVFFQGTGNVLQQSPNITWNNPSQSLYIGDSIQFGGNTDTIRESGLSGNWDFLCGQPIRFLRKIGEVEIMRIVPSTTNVLIGTTTDAGFKLDVNGTARVSGSSFFATTSGTLVSGTTTIVNMNYGEVPKTYLTGGTFMNGTVQFPTTLRVIATGGGIQFAQQSAPSPNSNLFFGNDSSGVYYGNYGSLPLKFMTSAVTQMTIFGTGNVGINTGTDAGFKLYVNGTVRAFSGFNAGSAYGTFTAGYGTDWAYTITGGEAAVITAANIQGTSKTIYGVTVPAESANLILGTSYGYDVGQSYNIISTADLGIIVNRFTNSTKFFKNGNVAIGSITDAGFRLDVNGTARIIQTSFSNNGIQILTNLSAAGGISLNGTLPTSNNMTVSGGFSLFASTTYSATSGNALTINSAVIQSTSGTVGLLGVGAQFAVASGNANFIGLNLTPTLNFTGTFTGTIRGFYYNPTLTSMTGVTAHYAIHTTSGRVRLEGLPTSPTGLSAGDLYNDGGTIKIV